MACLLFVTACARERAPSPAAANPEPAPASAPSSSDPRVLARERDRKQRLEIPTFELTGIQEHEELNELALFDLEGKPVGLERAGRPALVVLSSISCPVSRDNSKRLDVLAARYGDALSVRVIYTIEAHPDAELSPYSGDVWLTERNVMDGVLVKQPQALESRIALAKRYAHEMGAKAPLLVDAMNNAAWKRIGPAPNTALLIGHDGTVEVRQGWFEPDAMSAAIAKYLAKVARARKTNWSREDLGDLHVSEDALPSRVRGLLARKPELINYDLGGSKTIRRGTVALHLAAAKGDVTLVRELLQLGANIELADADGRTALHLAALRGERDILSELLRAHAPLHTPDLHGLTAVQLAMLHQQPQVVQQLLAAGAAHDVRIAAGLGEMEALARYLRQLERTDLYRRRDGGQALAYATANKQVAAMRALLEAGVDATQRVEEQPALYYALSQSDVGAVTLLADRGPVPLLTMSWPGRGPLHWLVHETLGSVTKLQLMRILLEHGADVDDLDSEGRTALHYAANEGKLELVELLLQHRADPNLRSGRAVELPCGPLLMDTRPVLRTPLHEALASAHIDIAKLLLTHGAKPAIEERDGLTAFDLVTEPVQNTAKEKLGELPRGSRRALPKEPYRL